MGANKSLDRDSKEYRQYMFSGVYTHGKERIGSTAFYPFEGIINLPALITKGVGIDIIWNLFSWFEERFGSGYEY